MCFLAFYDSNVDQAVTSPDNVGDFHRGTPVAMQRPMSSMMVEGWGEKQLAKRIWHTSLEALLSPKKIISLEHPQ